MRALTELQETNLAAAGGACEVVETLLDDMDRMLRAGKFTAARDLVKAAKTMNKLQATYIHSLTL